MPGNNGVRDNYVFSHHLGEVDFISSQDSGQNFETRHMKAHFLSFGGNLVRKSQQFDMTERKKANTRMTPTNCNESLKYYFFACKCFFQ